MGNQVKLTVTDESNGKANETTKAFTNVEEAIAFAEDDYRKKGNRIWTDFLMKGITANIGRTLKERSFIKIQTSRYSGFYVSYKLG